MTGVFEGVGSLQFTPDNKHAYAYGGLVNVTSAGQTLLTFNTQSEYLESRIQVSSDSGSSDNVKLAIYFNDIKVFGHYYMEDSLKPWTDILGLHLIIPPFTTVKLTAVSTAINTRPHYACVVAKVGGAIEQQNLEAITDNSKWASK